MDLLTYAVSQKLRQNNDMWRYLAENQPVPQDLIADAFASVIETYEDEEAVRLTSHYDDYLSHHIPVTFTPNGASTLLPTLLAPDVMLTLLTSKPLLVN